MNVLDIIEFIRVNVVAAATDSQFWLATCWCLIAFWALLIAGIPAARLLGILPAGASDAQQVGTGIATGVLILVSTWATLKSAGRSSFTPVAVAIWVCIAAAVFAQTRKRVRPTWPIELRNIRDVLIPVSSRAVATSGAFLILIALLYATTLSPSPREGVQPTEFMDVAFYSILGRDVGTTGIEDAFTPSGFTDIDGMPGQTWYHWGELWLAGLATLALSVEPMLARHVIVLPILLLASCALTGTLVRKAARRDSLPLLLFGSASCLLLAPLPRFDNPFTSWDSGLVVGVSQFGLAAVIVLLILVLAIDQSRALRAHPPPIAAVLIASLLPIHVVVATLAYVGCAVVMAFQMVARGRRSIRWRGATQPWGRFWTGTWVLVVATLAWGLASGHGIAASALSAGAAPFNEQWRTTLIAILSGSVVYFAIVAAIPITLRRDRRIAAVLVATIAVVVFGATAWGARIADYNTFYFFFAALALFASPVAAIAVVVLWDWLRARGSKRVAIVLAIVTLLQMEVGVVGSAINLYKFGANDHPPIPLAILDAIRQTGPGSKIGYACEPMGEISFWDSQLLTIDAHTDRRVVPLCYQLDPFAVATGGVLERSSTSPQFNRSPQARLFVSADYQPSPEETSAFMRELGIEYLLVDDRHPDVLGPRATVVAEAGPVRLLRVT